MNIPVYAGLALVLSAALMLAACSDDRGLDSGTGSSTGASVPTNTAAPGPRPDSTPQLEAPETEPSFVPAPSTPLSPQESPGRSEPEQG